MGKMTQPQKIALKAKATAMIAEMVEGAEFEATEIVDGIHIEMDGMDIVISAVVKKDDFDLEDAITEKADKETAKAEREAARATKAAEKAAKATAKAKEKTKAE